MEERDWFKRRDDYIEYVDGDQSKEVWNYHMAIQIEDNEIVLKAVVGPYVYECDRMNKKEANGLIKAIKLAKKQIKTKK
jgi:hypothetical protein